MADQKGCERWMGVDVAAGRASKGRPKSSDSKTQQVRTRECAEEEAKRAIRTRLLSALLRVHIVPIDQVVFLGPSGIAHLEGGFPLRCFQRLSRPHVATRQCRWRDNRNTRGASIPVLSY